MNQPTVRKNILLTLWILRRSLALRWLANSLTVIAMALGIGLALVVPMSLQAVRGGAVNAARIFQLLVTSQGSEIQSVLSTIYYQGAPVGNIPYSVVDALAADPRTSVAIPLGFGDNMQGYPLVGTTAEYFDLRPSPKLPPYYQIARGTVFSHRYQAVLGAGVVKKTGLELGDTFQTAHGFANVFEPTMHSQEYQVVGILEPTGGPSDKAVYTDIESLWHSHGQYSPASETLDASHACSHIEAPISSSLLLQNDVSNENLSAIRNIHIPYALTFPSEDNQDENEQVQLGHTEVKVAGAGHYIFYSNSDLTLAMHDADGNAIIAEQVALETDIENCSTISVAYVFVLLSGKYVLTLSRAKLPENPQAVIVMEKPSLLFTDDGVKTPTIAELADKGFSSETALLDTRDVTAIMYRGENISQVYQLAAQIDSISGVQSVFPAAVINQLSRLMGQSEQTYTLLARVILLLVAITIALNTYANSLQAQKSLAVLRAVGVARGTVASSVVLESIVLSLIGISIGIVLAYCGTLAVGQIVSSETSITLPLPNLTASEWIRAFMLLPVAVFFATIPALQAARKSPLENL